MKYFVENMNNTLAIPTLQALEDESNQYVRILPLDKRDCMPFHDTLCASMKTSRLTLQPGWLFR